MVLLQINDLELVPNNPLPPSAGLYAICHTFHMYLPGICFPFTGQILGFPNSIRTFTVQWAAVSKIECGAKTAN
jgi:hypothetical protein